jgi:branched-chain amino acid transport system ATP-binding protein
MLKIKELTTSYAGIVALDGASLMVRDGQAVAVIGANGAGKTTLLKTICGLLHAGRGHVEFDGTRLTGRPAYAIARDGILMVPEGRQILGPLTVEENLRLGHRAVAGRADVGPEDAMASVFALFPVLAERRWQFAGQLSGGQQQMLAIGRALMGRPRLLLLDEPSLGLGPAIVAQVFGVLGKLHREGLSMLLVEQNARRALEVTEYAYVMERGHIVHQGESRALSADPVIIDHYLGQGVRAAL